MKKYVTNIDEGIYFQEEEINELPFNDDYEWNVINIYPQLKISSWDGLGGAITEASGINYFKMSTANRQKFLEYYYSSTGLNYNLGRISIGSNDFCETSYEYCLKADLSDFNIYHDQEKIIPFLKDILAYKKITIMASPWSPPKVFKTNGSLENGGHLLPEKYPDYCKYLLMFLKAYEAENIPIAYLTIQNEPYATQRWESCLYSLDEQHLFTKKYLLPMLKKNKVNTKVFLWDHNKNNLYNVVKKLNIKDKMIAGVAFHNYAGMHFKNLELVHKDYPTYKLWCTEACQGFSEYDEKSWRRDAELYMLEMLGNINNGMTGYIDWNILLDSKGGPNHSENYCKSPIMLNANNEPILTPIYYYLKHLGSLITPGSDIITVDVCRPDLFVCAFKQDTTLTIIALNINDYPIEIDLVIANARFKDFLKPHSIVSYLQN